MSHWSDGFVPVNGTSIHYYRTGGSKPPVLLLHGFSDNGLCWTPIARRLEQDYELIMPEERGHGLSELPDAEPSREYQANDIAGVIQALALEKPPIIGHSMGASTAALTAANYPALVRAIVLEDPPWRASSPPPTDTPAKNSWGTWLSELHTQSREEIIAIGHRDNPAWSEEELGPWADSKLQFQLPRAQRPVMPGRTWREIVSHITCPILLITADPEKGAIVTQEVAQEAATLWKHGHAVHIGGAGHNIRREQPDTYMDVVTTFLKEH